MSDTEERKVMFNIAQGMISGQAEAVSRKYNKHVAKDGTIWLSADQPNAGDNIYCDGGAGSRGMGGATLQFTLIDDTILPLTGPWHANSSALYEQTGVDLRNTHEIFGIIAEEREYIPGSGVGYYYSKIIHEDEKPVIGPYNRIQEMAQTWAQENGRKCYYAFVSRSGGSAGQTS